MPTDTRTRTGTKAKTYTCKNDYVKYNGGVIHLAYFVAATDINLSFTDERKNFNV